MTTHSTPLTIGIYVFDQVEVLDFAGPFEVFSTATRVHKRTFPEQTPFEVFTVGSYGGAYPSRTELHAANITPIVARAGFLFTPHYSIQEHPNIDILLIPGGVVDAEMKNETLLTWIKTISANTQLTASVCTGAFLLAKANLLDQLRVTTHWEDIADLRTQFPLLQVEENARFIDNGKIITSAGISAGIDMSLHIVARFAGAELAKRTARQMEYDWRE